VDHYLDEKPPPVGRLTALAGRLSPVCSLIQQTADKFRVGVSPPRTFRHELVDAPAYTPAEYAERLGDFRQRLDAIVSYMERIGAIPILVVPPGNDAGFDPNRSFLPPVTTHAEREAFTRAFLEARSMEAAAPAQAIERYRSFLESQPAFAETHYRLARLLEKAGVWNEAYKHYIKAKDLDGLPMRCLTSFQDAYREIAARHGCAIIDGQALFHAIGPHGLLDDHLFVDAVHPSLPGHVALAQAILDAIRARGALGWPLETPSPRIDIRECADHFGFGQSDWKYIAERGAMFQYGTNSLRYDRRQREAKVRAFDEAVRRLNAGEPAEALGLPNLGMPLNAPLGGRSAARPAGPSSNNSGR
jgi:hypothetical protein